MNGLGGTTTVDSGDIWIVWDTPTGTEARNVWLYLKVDTIVGDRCFYAKPACTISVPAGYAWATVGNKIPTTLWGTDTVPPADVQALLAKGVVVNTAASDVRPEDALFESCRVNSLLGNGVMGFGDGHDGLGYGNNLTGTCASFGAPLSHLVGKPIKSGIAGSTSAANVLAFNISGHDPFTNQAIPAPAILDIGAYPVVFVFSRSSTVNHGLKGATNITSTAAQTVFSGANCDAHVIDAAIPAGTGITAFLREPLSGTMTTTEMSVFRRPVETLPTRKVMGVTQENNVGTTNPLRNTTCKSGTGHRTRGIGTGEVVNGNATSGGVLNSGHGNPDGIAYSFNGFGNFSKIAANSAYGYLKLDGVDPIGPIAKFPNQELPTCTVPCTETQIWGRAGGSFPQLRAGHYPAWSLIHLITTPGARVSAQDLITSSNTYVTGSVPDYIPAVAVTGANPDPGMKIWHTHYQQRDGSDNKLGGAPSNGNFNGARNPTGGDLGGDAGGCTISSAGIVKTTKTNFIQVGPGTTCSSTAVRN